MDLDIVFLGTSGSMPTAKRAPTATLIRRGGERLLSDCAEGTQRQFLRSGIGLIELRDIFLTHYHADHFLGLPGMLKTFALRGRELRKHRRQIVPVLKLHIARKPGVSIRCFPFHRICQREQLIQRFKRPLRLGSQKRRSQ